ncbi:MAG: alpha/beta fold hydrolase [Flavobacteriales bacterium]
MSKRNIRECLSVLLVIATLLMSSCKDKTEIKNTIATRPSTEDSIAPSQYIELGGLKQAICVAGDDMDNPILLLLHGGPGFTEMALFSEYNKDLEKKFIVVNWDQRGAGLSHATNIPDSTMTLEQFVNDAHELVTWLKKKYNKDKIYVLGHSWGSILGVTLVQRYPEDFYAYVGVGQGVNMFDNESLSFKFTLEKAIAEKNEEAIKELKAIQKRYPPNGIAQLEDLKIQRKWLGYYGGAIYGQPNANKIFSRIKMENNPLYNAEKAQAGNDYSFPMLFNELMRVNLMESAPKLEVPVYFITGRHDYNTPFILVEDYMEMLDAPHKEIIWFENSAHWIPFEEPEKFNNVLINKVRKHSHPNKPLNP